MKTMSCRQLGGTCDATLSAQTLDEMKEEGIKHGTKNHPEVIEKINGMDEGERAKFDERLQQEWDRTPEDNNNEEGNDGNNADDEVK